MGKVHNIEEEIERNLILDRIWLGQNSAPNCTVYHSYKVCQSDIEYVRKGIEKEETIKYVCEWIKYNNENGGCLFDGWENDLKKYLDGKV